MSDDDSDVLVAVFDKHPGGWLPVGEFAKLRAELLAAQEHVQRMSDMVATARVLWLATGFAAGLVFGVLMMGT